MMNEELEKLYGNSKIDIAKFTKKNESLESELSVKFSLLKNEINGKLDYQIIEIDTTNLTKEDIELSVLNKTLFNTEKDALTYSKYLMTLDNLVACALKVNIADNNYKPNYSNEDERKYVLSYNERTKSISYDFTYTILTNFTDYRIVFRTQTIAENFLNQFRSELEFINRYRTDDLKL